MAPAAPGKDMDSQVRKGTGQQWQAGSRSGEKLDLQLPAISPGRTPQLQTWQRQGNRSQAMAGVNTVSGLEEAPGLPETRDRPVIVSV